MNFQEIIQSQRDFFVAGNTRSLSFRRAALSRLRSSIKDNQERIIEAIQKDFGKPEFEILTNEILLTLQEINYAKKNLKTWMRPKYVHGGLFNIPSTAFTIHKPFGATLIMAPWNYPFNLAMVPLIGAVAAGNCAIVKPSEHTANTTGIILEILEEVFDENHVKGVKGDHRVGEALLKEKFDFIFFTGSTKVGKIVMKAAAENLTPLVLELGGKSPAIIHYDADIKAAARRVAWAKFLNGGQTCVAPDYLLVHEKIKDEFLRELERYFSKYRKGNGMNYARVIHLQAFERLESYLEEGEVIAGGEREKGELLFAPTILAVEDLEGKVMQEEIFGPVLPTMSYKNLEGAVEKVRKLPKPMAIYFFSGSKRLQKIARENMPSGDFCVNDAAIHFASPTLPVGGYGHSGMGKYHGKDSFVTFSHKKTVLRKPKSLEIPLRYPPYGRYLGIVRKMIRYFF